VELRNLSVAQPANGSRNGSVAEIRLAGALPPSGFLRKRGRKIKEIVHKRRASAATLLVTKDALVVHARAELKGRLEIPWDRAALGERLAIGDVDHDDLEYLARTGYAHSGNGHAANGASGNGASGNGAAA